MFRITVKLLLAGLLGLGGTIFVIFGCQRESQVGPTPKKPKEVSQQPTKDRAEKDGKGKSETVHKPAKPEPPPKPTIRKVSLTKELAATCLVNVGDTIPEGELVELAGQPRSLRGLWGEKLTVLCFWKTGTNDFDRVRVATMLGDLQQEVAKPFGSKGVRVVGINVGGDTEGVKQVLSEAEATFPVLLDPKGDYFVRIATEKLPRIYLLDSQGQVLWFDIEYSRTTRRDLIDGIRAVLGEE